MSLPDAVDEWAQALRHLGGDGALTSFRDLATGTIDLEAADPHARQALLAGDPVALTRLFPHDPVRTAAGRSAVALHACLDAAWRAHGLAIGWLAIGFATWSDPFATRRPMVPVLLRPLRIDYAAGDPEPVLLVGPTPLLNPALLPQLTHQLGLRVDAADLLDADGELRYPVVAERLTSLAPAHVVDGFALRHRAVLLAGSLAAVQAAELLEAAVAPGAAPGAHSRLAGWLDPAAAVPAPPTLPATPGPPVVDLDRHQAAVVAAVLEHGTVLVDAPPGTGATQVAIAVTAAVLQADPDAQAAVVGHGAEPLARWAARWRELGLGSLLHDLPSMPGVGSADGPDEQGAPRVLAATPAEGWAGAAGRLRADLATHWEALHAVRDPWGLTLLDALHTADAPGGAGAANDGSLQLRTRLPRDVLEQLDAQRAITLRADLATFVELGGLRIDAGSTPWFGAAITDEEDGRAALDAARRLSTDLLPRLRDVAARAAVEVGLPVPESPAQAAALTRRLQEVAGLEETFGPQVWQEPLDRLVGATGGRSDRRAVSQPPGLAERRRLRQHAAALARRPDVAGNRQRLHEALLAARELRREWVTQARDGRLPRCAAASAGLAATVDEVEATLGVLTAVHPTLGSTAASPGWDPAGEPFPGLRARLHALASDPETPIRLPRLAAAAAALADAGLGPVVAELRELDQARRRDGAGVPADAAVAAFEACRATSLAAVLMAGEQTLQASPEQIQQQRERYRVADVAASAVSAQTLVGGVPRVWVGGPLAVTASAPTRLALLVVLGAHAVPAAFVAALAARADRVLVIGDQLGVAGAHPPLELDHAVPPAAQPLWQTLARRALLLPIHYRARHEQLVQPWADGVHGGRLAYAPGVDDRVITWRHVAQLPGIKGQEDSVDVEAEEVAALVAEHVRDRPDESVAVVTLGAAHAVGVRAAIRRLAARTVGLAGALRARPDEPVLVLTADELRGEVRDAVIVTVGFGRTIDGRLLYRFGPLSRPGGERCLAAALSRARVRCTVVSSLTADDLDRRRLAAEGAWRLREILAWAQAGGTGPITPAAWGRPAPRPVEASLLLEVAQRLRAEGLPVLDPRGAGDLGVAVMLGHPRRPGRRALAVDVDACSVPDVRTRERLLPEHWAGLGWAHCRLSTVRWVQDADAEVTRVMAALAEAERQADAFDAARYGPRDAVEASAATSAARDPVATVSGAPPVPTGRPVSAYPPPELAALASWVAVRADLDADAPASLRVDLLRRALGLVGEPAAVHRASTLAVRAAAAGW
jgi:hypothetical protein